MDWIGVAILAVCVVLVSLIVFFNRLIPKPSYFIYLVIFTPAIATIVSNYNDTSLCLQHDMDLQKALKGKHLDVALYRKVDAYLKEEYLIRHFTKSHLESITKGLTSYKDLMVSEGVDPNLLKQPISK